MSRECSVAKGLEQVSPAEQCVPQGLQNAPLNIGQAGGGARITGQGTFARIAPSLQPEFLSARRGGARTMSITLVARRSDSWLRFAILFGL